MKCLAFALLMTVAMVPAGALAGNTTGPIPANVYVASPVLPVGLKRVLLLPFACENPNNNLSGGCETLDPVLQQELTKVGRFEIVSANPEALRTCTGSLSWTGDEVLPANFFESLKHVYACDAVLFCELTRFRPDPPLAIGLRLKLADASTGKILWSTDEVFDAGNLDVAKSAQEYEKARQPHHNIAYNVYSFFAWCVNTPTRSALDDQWNILNSPRLFGQYCADTLLQTLPPR